MKGEGTGGGREEDAKEQGWNHESKVKVFACVQKGKKKFINNSCAGICLIFHIV